MKPTPQHYSALIVACIVLLLSISGYVFIYHSVNVQASRTTAAFTNVDAARSEQSHEEDMVASLVATADDRAQLTTFFVSDDQIVNFIEEIESIGTSSDSQVSLVSISADDMTNAAKGTVGHLSTHISIQGIWQNSLKALHIIENLPYSISMDNVRVSKTGMTIGSKARPSVALWDIDFDMNTLIIK